MSRLPLSTALVQFTMRALPDGGQRTARRNAWAGMSADAVRARARREADAALEQALRGSARQDGWQQAR